MSNQMFEFRLQKCRACETCVGFEPGKTNKLSCASCKCFKNFHLAKVPIDITLDKVLQDRTTLKPNEDAHSKCLDAGYTWLPCGLRENEIDEYFADFNEEEIPKIQGQGAIFRIKSLMFQIPLQDIDPDFCESVVTQDEREIFTKFKSEMLMKFGLAEVTRLTDEYICEECKGLLGIGKLAAIVNVGNQTAYWHPHCFKCRKCSDLLADLAYCRIGFSLYCVRHFNDNLRSRCYTCDEIICQTNFISSMNNHWHVEHLSCWRCDRTLAGNKLIMKEDRTYCLDCFEGNFCHTCEKCKIKIGADMKDIAYQNKHWHGACFYCFRCDKSLIGQPFVFHLESLCCIDCFNEHYAARCFKCNKVFKPGAKKLGYRGNEYHESCFICEFCENPISSSSFSIKDEKVCCKQCYDNVFATKCHRCGKVPMTILSIEEKMASFR
ncbi:hypothetical protein ACOME3_003409 [Neoechinorhynchus agilis]